MTAGSASAGVAELEYAARMGHLDIVRHLVELGVRDTEDSALVAAAMCARQPWPIMELLLAAGKAAEASSSEPEGSLNRRLGAALIAASGQGRAGLVEQLLEYQRGERAPDSSMPPALSRNILDTALCAATMASREFTHPFGWSKPFFLPSSTHARQWIISMLVERGADVEAEPSAAMRAALKARDGKMTARLLSERRAVPQ
jgi:ankyrin repeat protein